MGEKYTTEAISGYNSSPPADDGTTTEANKVKWVTHKDKLSDPIKTQVANINTKILAMADIGADAKTANYTTLTGDHQKTLEVTSASVTITLLAVSTAPAGYTIIVKNSSGTTAAIDAAGAETIDGSTDSITLTDNESTIVQLNAAGDGYITLKQIEQIGKGADIASATALTLGADGRSFDVTGTTTITSIDTVKVGFHVTLQFDDILILTHNAADLILPGAANITTAAGDIAVFWEYATGDWRCISYTIAALVEGTITGQSDLATLSTVTQAYIDIPIAGTTYTLASADTEGSNTDAVAYAKKKEIAVPHNGTVDVYFEIQLTGAGTCYGRIYVNGSGVGTERSVNGSYSAFNETVSISAGDLVQLYVKQTNASNTYSFKNFRIRTTIPEVYTTTLDSTS